MVVDADKPTFGDDLATGRLMRSDVVGTHLAATVFALLDAVYMSSSGAGIRAWSS